MKIAWLTFLLAMTITAARSEPPAVQPTPFDYVFDPYYCDWGPEIGDYALGYYRICGAPEMLTATELVAESARNGDARDMVTMANGAFNRAELQEGFRWLEAAAGKNQVAAIVELADLHRTGKFGYPNSARAADLYRKVVEAAERDRAGGFGVMLSQYRLALMEARGEGIPKNDADATLLFKAAAAAHNENATLILGLRLARGLGSPPDGKSAIAILTTLYEQRRDWYQENPAKAAALIAKIFDEGIGLPENPEKAFHWYRLAAEHGDLNAMTRLVFMYRDGRGVDKDPEQQAYWEQVISDRNNFIENVASKSPHAQ